MTGPGAAADLSTMEPLLPDERVEQLAEKLRSEFGHAKLAETKFVTFIQPPQQVKKNGLVRDIETMVVFAVITPNPRPSAKGVDIMGHGTVSLADWRETEAERSHFAGQRDPAHTIFKAVVTNHLETLQNLREMI